MKSMLNLKTIVKVLAAVSFVGGMSFAWGDPDPCNFQDITNDTDLVNQANNCYKNGQYGLLVHKWDGQDAFGETIDGNQGHPELSISSSLISINIIAAAKSNCTICTYNEPDNPMSYGGVIYDLSYLKEKMSSSTNGSDYGTSPILCGFSEDGGTINRPSRAGCGVTKNDWKKPDKTIICDKDIWGSDSGTNTVYWPDNNESGACTRDCMNKIGAGSGNCVGNVPSGESSKNNPIPYYIKGSQASYNFDKSVQNPQYSGTYDEVLTKIITETDSFKVPNNYNEILLDQTALKSKENSSDYDAKSIVAFFVTNNTDPMNYNNNNTCTIRKHFSTKYEDLPILSLDTTWTDKSNEDGPFSLFSSSSGTCKDASLTCTKPNPSDIKVWTSGPQNTYKFCVHPTAGSGLDAGDTYICTQQTGPNNHCPNSGPGPSSVPAYWKKQPSTQT
jgi:hypothetical protein